MRIGLAIKDISKYLGKLSVGVGGQKTKLFKALPWICFQDNNRLELEGRGEEKEEVSGLGWGMGGGKELLRSCWGFVALFTFALQNSCRMPGWE